MINWKVDLVKGLFDSHTHVAASDLQRDVAQIVDRAKQAGLTGFIDVGVDLATSERAIKNAMQYKGFVWAAAGIDPQEFLPAGNISNLEDLNNQLDQLAKLVDQNIDYIGAIGETGMDFYYLNNPELTQAQINHSKQLQLRAFVFQIELAAQYNLPLTIHSRGAEQECIDLLIKMKIKNAVLHSFTGTLTQMQQAVSNGIGIGVNGIATFKSSIELRSNIKLVSDNSVNPADFYAKGVYFETDAPYLSPEPDRKAVNEPSRVIDILGCLAG